MPSDAPVFQSVLSDPIPGVGACLHAMPEGGACLHAILGEKAFPSEGGLARTRRTANLRLSSLISDPNFVSALALMSEDQRSKSGFPNPGASKLAPCVAAGPQGIACKHAPTAELGDQGWSRVSERGCDITDHWTADSADSADSDSGHPRYPRSKFCALYFGGGGIPALNPVPRNGLCLS